MSTTTLTGKLADPEFRKRRAQAAAAARHSLDVYVRAVVRDAPKLTDEQVSELRAAIAATRNGGA